MIRIFAITILGIGGISVLILLIHWVVLRDENPELTRRGKLKAQLDAERETVQKLHESNRNMRAKLIETRLVLRQIASTAQGSDDRILAGHHADAIGEFLIDEGKSSSEVS